MIWPEAIEGGQFLTARNQAAAERIVLDPKYHDLLAILKGARNGAVYGTKVRFPHALVYGDTPHNTRPMCDAEADASDTG